MTAPYYADDRVTLYHGDCRDITAWLEADVLVFDPPYGESWQQGEMGARRRRPNAGRYSRHRGIANDTDTSIRDAVLELWGDQTALCFGSLTAPAPAGNRQTLVYRKPPDAGARGALGGRRRDLEAVFMLGPWPAGIGGRSSLLTTATASIGNPSGPSGRYGHPHAKPVDLCEDLIAGCPPGAIADPTAGAGSIVVAARNLGRRVIAVELEEHFCEATARRLAQDCLDLEQAR